MTRSNRNGPRRADGILALAVSAAAVSCVALVDLDDLSSHEPEPVSSGAQHPTGGSSDGDDGSEQDGATAGGGIGSEPSSGSGSSGGGQTSSASSGAGGGASGVACDLPWGGTIAHNESVTAYEFPSAPYGEVCKSETRVCIDGALTGSFENADCQEAGNDYPLVDSSKTIQDCLDVGGEPVEIAAGDFLCRRGGLSCTGSGCSCWSGWSQYGKWSTTESEECSGSCCGASYSPTTGEHGWGDVARESEAYFDGPSNCGFPPNINNCDEKTCWAKVTQLGCH